jgi:hypothetical protein
MERMKIQGLKLPNGGESSSSSKALQKAETDALVMARHSGVSDPQGVEVLASAIKFSILEGTPL